MKRYSVCRFPSLYGTPWETDSWLLSRMLYAIRNIIAFIRFDPSEILICDNKKIIENEEKLKRILEY